MPSPVRRFAADNDSSPDINLEEPRAEVDSSDSEDKFCTSGPIFGANETQSKKNDLLLVCLLRHYLACASKGTLSHSLPEISSELYELGMLSKRARDLAAEPPSNFNESFDHAFQCHMSSSKISEFWKSVSNSNEDNASRPKSRYLTDFKEIRLLGHGGFGHVLLCQNKLDGQQYAVKKIPLKDKHLDVEEKIWREVATLASLQHQHVVRYYQAWIGTEYGNYDGDNTYGSRTAESYSWSYTGASTDVSGPNNRQGPMYLYIQMEYCPRTLHQAFKSWSTSDKDNEYIWHLFRQIVEGLAHIHSRGIIHRDLTPSNIFFDARNDIKIGDFGLAKFLELEQLDRDHYSPTGTKGVSMDGTSQVGTGFYRAPEIEQRLSQINEKVDMYSLGVIFFELWHPFATQMERHIVLLDLKQNGELPSSWVEKFPEQSTLLRRLMSLNPSDRPSATELLQHDLPPRMEDEWLNDLSTLDVGSGATPGDLSKAELLKQYF